MKIEEIINSIEEEINNCRNSGKIAISTNLRICPVVKGYDLYISNLEKLVNILKLPDMSFIDVTKYLLNNPRILISDLNFITNIIDYVFSNESPKYIKKQKETIQDFNLEEHINSEIFKKSVLNEYACIITDKNNYTLEMLASIQLIMLKEYSEILDFNILLDNLFEDFVLNNLIEHSYTKKLR